MSLNNILNRNKPLSFTTKRLFCYAHKHLYLLFSFFLFVGVASAQELQNISILEGKELHSRIRFQFLPVQMPTGEFPNLKNTMGVLGLHYQIPITSSFYGGVGMYTALTGDQGGLFTLGTEIGYQKQLLKHLYLDANFHFGAGGGYRFLVNDGAFINPNIGFKYQKNNFSFGVQYSHFNFYTGKIKSDNISFFLEIPSVLRYTNIRNSQKEFISNNLTATNFWKKPATKNSQIVRFDFFFPFGKSKRDNLQPLKNTLSVLGFEYQKHLDQKSFLFIHTDAIYKGLRAGFMDLFLGYGYLPYQHKNFNIFTKLGLGAAGGRVAPEGGLMIYPSTGIEFNFSPNFSLNTHVGYYRSLVGDLEAYTAGFGLKYNSLNGGAFFKSKKIPNFYTQEIWISLQNQTYFKVNKTDSTPVDLQLLALQFQIALSKTFYVIGEASFAYAGASGGYAQGLAGIGLNTPHFYHQKMQFYLEIAAGAAGGAGVDSGEGIVVRPTLGVRYKITNDVSLHTSAGKMLAPFGNINSTNINIGVSFGIATLSAKNK